MRLYAKWSSVTQKGSSGGALANGAQMVRHHNTRDSAHEIIRILLGKEPVITKLQRQLVDEKTPLEKTDAGLVIGEDLEDKLRKKHEEMDELNAEKEKALESNNQNWLRRLEAQEKLARVKGQELIKQLHVLKASKGRQSETTSPQCYHNQGGVISPGLPSRFRPQEEAKTNEPTQNAILQIMPSDPCLSGQQEWENWKNDRVAREIARIESESAYLRNHTSTRGPLRFLVDAAVAFGSTLGQIVHLEFGSPSSVAVDSHHSRGHPSPTHESSSQNERTSFRSSQPVCTPGIEDMESRHGPNDDSQCWRQSDGLGSIHDELKGCAATSRKQN
ncbi:hypothetical protein OPQ81_010675 [Rhizoctonia solani]|nr:hypothetical protein OPQ81_010675 [Rhizoctonia solani]